MDARMNRKGFVAMTGAAGLAAFLAACGGSSSDSGSSSEGGDSAAATATAAATTTAAAFDPATEPNDPVRVFTWAGYDDSPKDGFPPMWAQYSAGPYGEQSPLEFTFLDDDTQALAKVASGFGADIMHPCGSFIKKWQEAGLIQPLDTSLLPDWAGVPESLKANGFIDGVYYHLPFDTGFTALTYDADAVNFDESGGEESWKVLLDSRYKGKMSLFRGPDEVIGIGALINRGAKDPWTLSLEEIEAAKETALQVKGNLRNYWTSQTETINDFVNGNLLVTSTWPDGYWRIKNHPKMKGRNIKYMQPVEGRILWVCGMVLSATSPVPGRSMMAMASTNTPAVSAQLLDDWQYAGAQQNGVDALIKNKELISVFGIDQPELWAPPYAWPQAPVEPYKEYIAAGQEVLDS